MRTCWLLAVVLYAIPLTSFSCSKAVKGENDQSSFGQLNNIVNKSISHRVSPPRLPTGPLFERTNAQATFKTDDYSCNQNHSLEYCFAFRKTENSKIYILRDYESCPQAMMSWLKSGAKEVLVKARCSHDDHVQSEWSKPVPVTIISEGMETFPNNEHFHLPSQSSSSSKSLIVIVHGQGTDPDNINFVTMKKEFLEILKRKADLESYDVRLYDWREHASGEGMPTAYTILLAGIHGDHLACWIFMQDRKAVKYDHIHLIGHSLGAKIIDQAAYWISRWDKSCTVHTTFLDAFTPKNWASNFGKYSTWSDHYYNKFRWDNDDYWFTDHNFGWAFNVDVTKLKSKDYYNDHEDGHAWPVRWYTQTIKNFSANDGCDKDYGFALSKEANPTIWANPPSQLPQIGRKNTGVLP